MHVNTIISEPAVKIIKRNVNIAVYRLNSQATSHGDFMYAFLGCYLPIQPPLNRVCDVASFSPCTDSSHELRDLQHFMSEQIDLYVFKTITAASCVDIIVNKCLNKYN